MKHVSLVAAMTIFSVTACTTAPRVESAATAIQDSGLEKVSIVALGLE